MWKRILLLAAVTFGWLFLAAWLSTEFIWAKGSPGSRGGIAWWLWLVLAALWWLVIAMTPKKKPQG